MSDEVQHLRTLADGFHRNANQLDSILAQWRAKSDLTSWHRMHLDSAVRSLRLLSERCSIDARLLEGHLPGLGAESVSP
jgi:hypothetical protein